MSLVSNFLIPFSEREYRILKQYFSLDSDFLLFFFKDSIHIETNVDINFLNVTFLTKLYTLFLFFLHRKLKFFFQTKCKYIVLLLLLIFLLLLFHSIFIFWNLLNCFALKFVFASFVLKEIFSRKFQTEQKKIGQTDWNN